MAEFFIIFVSIVFSAFFSGMEMAYVSSNRMLTELERKKSSRTSKAAIFLADHSKQYLTAMIVGNTIALVVYGYFMGGILIHWLRFASFLPDAFIMILQVVVSTLIILITAEFLPKIVFNIFSNKLFRFFAPIALIFYWLLSPVTWFVGILTNLFLKLTGDKNPDENQPIFLKEELAYFLDEQIEETKDSNEEIDSEVHIFKNALNFSDLQARNCIIHRKDIMAANINDSIESLKQKFIETGLSKIVIFRDNIDNIIGYVHSFDLFKKPKEIRHILIPIEIVHETTPIQDVMNRMMKKKKSLVIVLDEYGGTSGLLTLEDIVEELFGDIEDEHDKVLNIEKEIEENHYLFSAKLEVDYLNEKYDLDIPENDEYFSLGGFIISLTEDIPTLKEEIVYKNKKFIITKVSNSRIEELEVIITLEEK
ncbi:MAG: hemolysin family protein [Flavobacteriaceae bacterium]|nr:hemolysin family protein [Flavobacteriaceae bacterium]